jgi:hypothetical protein
MSKNDMQLDLADKGLAKDMSRRSLHRHGVGISLCGSNFGKVCRQVRLKCEGRYGEAATAFTSWKLQSSVGLGGPRRVEVRGAGVARRQS